jgi:hypothetical protein
MGFADGTRRPRRKKRSGTVRKEGVPRRRERQIRFAAASCRCVWFDGCQARFSVDLTGIGDAACGLIGGIGPEGIGR